MSARPEAVLETSQPEAVLETSKTTGPDLTAWGEPPYALPMKPIRNLTLGRDHFLLISEEGGVYSCGVGEDGQLGLGVDLERQAISVPTRIPQKFFDGKPVVAATTGEKCSFFLSEDGVVFSCGLEKNGRLGHGDDQRSIPTPTRIPQEFFDKKPVIGMTIGAKCNFFVCSDGSDGSVYTSGEFYTGVINPNPVLLENCFRPVLLENCFRGESVVAAVAIAAESKEGGIIDCTFFLTREGCVYCISADEGGAVFKIVPHSLKEESVIKIAAMGYSICFLCKNGSVYSSGEGQYGNLGHGDTADCPSATGIPKSDFGNKIVVDVGVSPFHSVFVCKDGVVYTCGYGPSGELGDPSMMEEKVLSPRPVGDAQSRFDGQLVVKAVAGLGCSFVLTDQGRVYNCGEGYLGRGWEDSVDVFTQVKTCVEVEDEARATVTASMPEKLSMPLLLSPAAQTAASRLSSGLASAFSREASVDSSSSSVIQGGTAPSVPKHFLQRSTTW